MSLYLLNFDVYGQFAGLAQLVEQLICNQQVVGSTPIASLPAKGPGGVPERPKGAGCKPADVSLHRFESYPLHRSWRNSLYAEVAQLARALAFQAKGRGFESRLPLQSYS